MTRAAALVVLVLLLGCGAKRIGDTDADGGSAGSRVPSSQVVFPTVPLTVNVELARTEPQRARGLGGHAPLGEREGMLFIFDQPGLYAFWMKGMTFPLDIMWIEDDRVVHLEVDLPPPGPGSRDADLPVYGPRNPAHLVLEVHAGFAKKHGVGIGTLVEIRGVA
jgi:hypothetical protein